MPSWILPSCDLVNDTLDGIITAYGAATYDGQPVEHPEVRAVRAILGLSAVAPARNFHIKIAMNAHSFGGYLIRPNLTFLDTLDPSLRPAYEAIGGLMTEQNEYVVGGPVETVGYCVTGAAVQAIAGESGVRKDQGTGEHILAFTPEIGAYETFFNPPNSALFDYNMDAIPMFLEGLKCCGVRLCLEDVSLNNGYPVRQTQHYPLSLTVCNHGREQAGRILGELMINSMALPAFEILGGIGLSSSEDVAVSVHVPSLGSLTYSDDLATVDAELAVYEEGHRAVRILFPFQITIELTGDANDDGEVNVLDVMTVLHDIMFDIPASNQDQADANNDGAVNVLDLQAIVSIAIGSAST